MCMFFFCFVLRINWKIGYSSNTSRIKYFTLPLPVYVVICVTGSSTEMKSEPGSRRRWSDDTIDDRGCSNISRAMRTGRIDNEMTVEKSKGERNICSAQYTRLNLLFLFLFFFLRTQIDKNNKNDSDDNRNITSLFVCTNIYFFRSRCEVPENFVLFTKHVIEVIK